MGERATSGSGFPQGGVFNASVDAIVVMSSNGLVIDWNAAAERMFGHAHDEAVGRELADIIIPAALRDKHRAALARWRDTREATVLNRRLALFALHASGEVFPVELTITQIAADDELFAGFVRDRREPAPAP